MFIALAEFLRCPAGHAEDTQCVVLPEQMVDRDVRSGVVGCPICRREYPIVNGAAVFGASPARPTGLVAALPDPAVVQALLGIAGPGGYVVLAGSAVGLTAGLRALQSGVHIVAVNPPDDRETPGGAVSVVCHDRTFPLKSAMARGVVIGSEYACQPWLDEGARLLLKGLRLVVLHEGITIETVEGLAEGDGHWVGRKR
jgi:hypothetical protein